MLAARGNVPISVDNLSTGYPWAVKWGDAERCDIRDTDRLSDVFKHHKPDAVIHFAAHCYVGESVIKPEKYYNNNVGGMISLLEVMRRHAVNKLIFSSSSVIYGDPQSIPIKESHPSNPINPYGVSKYLGERMIVDYKIAYDFQFVSLRYFNAAGADPDAEVGEAHNPETHLIPSILDAAIGRREKISIFGTDYDTYDGTCIRDYVHVWDLADAHIRALDHLLGDGESCFLNLGNGNGYSVREVIACGTKVTGQELKIDEQARRRGDPARLISNSTQAQKVLGWRAKRGSLETMIEDAWRWHKKYFSGKKF
jgi:UDP-glucose-4-epimerase GalE